MFVCTTEHRRYKTSKPLVVLDEGISKSISLSVSLTRDSKDARFISWRKNVCLLISLTGEQISTLYWLKNTTQTICTPGPWMESESKQGISEKIRKRN